MEQGRELAAILFLTAGMNAMDVYSATNSSPWTAHNFAGDQESVEALWKYVRHAMIITVIQCGGGAVIAKSWWPVLGALISGAYMNWLYYTAVTEGKAQGNEGWSG